MQGSDGKLSLSRNIPQSPAKQKYQERLRKGKGRIQKGGHDKLREQPPHAEYS
jgi:hypothetical protein